MYLVLHGDDMVQARLVSELVGLGVRLVEVAARRERLQDAYIRHLGSLKEAGA